MMLGIKIEDVMGALAHARAVRGFFPLRNRLQYLYSIVVFVGVLVTAYLMMNSENQREPLLRAFQATSPVYRPEAATLDPGLNQLFEMEQVLSKMRKERTEEQKRLPTQALPTKNKPSFVE